MECKIQKLIRAINEKKHPDEINAYIEVLSERLNETSKEPIFYHLPIDAISSIVKNADFNEENDPITLIKNILDKINQVHEKEEILLLNNFSEEKMPQLTIENIIDIASQSKSSQLLTKLGELQKEEKCTVNIDYDREIEQLKQNLTQKKQENAQLRRKLEEFLNRFPPVTEKPEDFEPNLIRAIKLGKVTSVQYLIEVEGADKEAKDRKGCTPFFIACQEGKLEVVQYLCERQKINKEAANQYGWTPFFAACAYGKLDVVKYLCERQNINKEAVNKDGWTRRGVRSPRRRDL